MMEIEKFCETVLSYIPRATRAEREAIRAELEDHLADHRDARIEEGMDYRAAVLAATQAMGDPAEIGRAMNEQLSPFWLRMEKSFWYILVVVLLVLRLAAVPVVHLTQAAAVRVAPGLVFDLWLDQLNGHYSMDVDLERDGYTLRENVDIRMALGNGELRICRIYMDPTPGNNRLAVAMVLYNQDWMGYVSDRDLWYMNFQSQRQEGHTGSVGDVVAVALRVNIPVYPGDTCATLIYKRFGEDRTLKIPILWEVAP